MGMFSGILDSIGTAGKLVAPFVPLVGAAMTAYGGYRQNEANKEAAQKQMMFQERMSGTSYQRAVGDMQEAGLSPMLAYSQGGASSPAGASYHAENVEQSSVQSAFQAAQLQGVQSQTEKTAAEAELVRTETALMRERVPFEREHQELSVVMKRVEQQVQSYSHELQKWLYRGGVALGEHGGAPLQVQRALQELKEIQQNIAESRSHEELNRAVSRLRHLEVPEGMAFADFYKSAAGKAAPYVDQVARGVSSALGGFRDFSIGRRMQNAVKPRSRPFAN